MILPNPFTDSVVSTSLATDTAAASSPLSPLSDAAANQSAAEGGGPEIPAVVARNSPEAAGTLDHDATDDIHEIFYWARKLQRDRRFVLDVDAFMLELEEPPLFLRVSA